MKAEYITNDFDKTIDEFANVNCYVFGHSDKISNLVGYWCFVQTIGYIDYFSQIAIGSVGMAYRFYEPQKGWTGWSAK